MQHRRRDFFRRAEAPERGLALDLRGCCLLRRRIQPQRQGLGVGWLPRDRIAGLLERGELIEKEMVDPREPNQLFVAWRGDHQGRGLDWWLKQLKDKRLGARLVRGIDFTAVVG